MTKIGPRPWQRFYPQGTRHDIDSVDVKNLAELCRRGAQDYGNTPAFSLCLPNGMGATLTFNEVDRYSDEFAVYLREVLGLKPGSRVALQAPNSLVYPIAAFGIFKAACVLVNINPLYTAEEMAKTLQDCKPDCLVIIDMFADKLPQAMALAPVHYIVTFPVTEFMTGFKKLLVNFVQRYVKKQVPACTVKHATFANALALARARGKVDVAAYTAGVGLNDVACLQYTGGTTGVSKGAMLTHSNLLFNLAQAFEMLDTKPNSDIVLTALPLYHIFAFTVNFLGYWRVGGHNVLVPSPRPVSNLRKPFEMYKFTFTSGVNTLFNALNNEEWFRANPPRTMERVSSGGMSLHKAVGEEFQRLTGSRVVEGYGLTETSPVVTFNPVDHVKFGSIGIPVPSTDVRIVDDNGVDVALGQPGELIVKGPQVMLGYWQRPDETEQSLKDGWFYTGDIATQDEDGYFTIVDRKKDMINVSGFNVFPNEIEDLLGKHPGILEAAVIGIPDQASGEVVKAFVVKRDPSLTEKAVKAFCREHLTGYKCPKIVEFRTDLPKTPVGKILRKDLR